MLCTGVKVNPDQDRSQCSQLRAHKQTITHKVTQHELQGCSLCKGVLMLGSHAHVIFIKVFIWDNCRFTHSGNQQHRENILCPSFSQFPSMITSCKAIQYTDLIPISPAIRVFVCARVHALSSMQFCHICRFPYSPTRSRCTL